MDILLKNLNIVTQNESRDVFIGDILVGNNQIKKIAKKINSTDIKYLDLSGITVIPGLIQTHIHLCQALFRNLADDLELLDWLTDRIWPMEMAHTESSLRASARLGLTELLRSGVTSILDMGSALHMDVVFEEMAKSGIRGYSGKVMMDFGIQSYKESTKDAVESSERLIKKWNGERERRIHYALAPRFVLSCSKELWEAIADLQKKYDLIIHSHASENRKEVEIVKTQTGYNNVEFFIKMNLGSPKLCLAHCVWVTEKEIEYLADSQINVLHCPAANLKLGSGFAPIPKFIKQGINVSLGSDGAPCNNNMDIFQDMRLAALIHKPNFGVTSINSREVFDMATINGAKTLGMEDKIGSIEEGKLADLTFINLNKVHTTPADNIYSQIIYSAHSKDVIHVMVDGNWVVKDGTPIAYDEKEIIQDAWEECTALIHRIQKIS